MKKIVLTFLPIFVLVLLLYSSISREMIVMLTFYSGDVKIVRDGDTIFPSLDMIVLSGDRIITGENGIAELSFEDSTTVVLEEKTEMAIEDATIGEEGERFVSLRSFIGKLVTNVRKKVDKGSYVVNTPQGKIKVKGTVFVTEVKEDSTTEVTVLRGSVLISSLMDEARSFILSQDSQGIIKEGISQIEIRKLTTDEINMYRDEVMNYLRDTGIFEEIDMYMREKINMDVDSSSCVSRFIGWIMKLYNRVVELWQN